MIVSQGCCGPGFGEEPVWVGLPQGAIKWRLGRASWGLDGVPPQSQTSPWALELVSRASPQHGCLRVTTCAVAEGVMDATPVTQAEATWLFYLGSPVVWVLAHSIGYV